MDNPLYIFGLIVVGYIAVRYILPVVFEVGNILMGLLYLAVVGAIVLYLFNSCGASS